jgi:hypothetical protein
VTNEKKDRCGKHLAAPTLIDRIKTIHWVGVSRKGIEIIEDGGQIKREKDIYQHIGPRPIPIICHLSDPPFFSLFTTFNSNIDNIKP